MAEKQLNTIIVLKNDTKANWDAVKDIATLRVGELGIESDTGLFKIGKEKSEGVLCTWAELDYANDIPEVDLSSVTNGVQVVGSYEALVAGSVIGDMGIVKELVYEDTTNSANNKYSHTAYVWNGTSWEAMDGNYDANNVYFDSNLVMTTNIGVQTLGSGVSSRDLNTKGKSLKQVFSMILAKEEKPTISTNPSVTTKISNGANSTPHASNNITVEGGTTVTPKWEATFSAGAYSYGPATGLTPTAWDVKGYIGSNAVSGHASTSNSGTFDAITLAASEVYKINAKATYNAGAIANTNLGEPYQAGNALFDATNGATKVQIAAGSKNDDSPTITAWQQGYYIGTCESDVEITSDILRAVDTNKLLKNRLVKGGNYATATNLAFSPSGTMAKFVIAYPASKDMTNGEYDSTKGLQRFFNNSS